MLKDWLSFIWLAVWHIFVCLVCKGFFKVCVLPWEESRRSVSFLACLGYICERHCVWGHKVSTVREKEWWQPHANLSKTYSHYKQCKVGIVSTQKQKMWGVYWKCIKHSNTLFRWLIVWSCKMMFPSTPHLLHDSLSLSLPSSCASSCARAEQRHRHQ